MISLETINEFALNMNKKMQERAKIAEPFGYINKPFEEVLLATSLTYSSIKRGKRVFLKVTRLGNNPSKTESFICRHHLWLP